MAQVERETRLIFNMKRAGPLRACEFRCDTCGEIFHKKWSDEDALTELKHLFNVPVSECVLICEDCFHDILGVDI